MTGHFCSGTRSQQFSSEKETSQSLVHIRTAMNGCKISEGTYQVVLALCLCSGHFTEGAVLATGVLQLPPWDLLSQRNQRAGKENNCRHGKVIEEAGVSSLRNRCVHQEETELLDIS